MIKHIRSLSVFSLACIFVVLSLLASVVMFFLLTGKVNLFYTGFALDSQGRLYVGKASKIDVWEDGRYITSISPQTSHGYAFTIQHDSILLAANSNLYTMDLSGNILTQKEDAHTQEYNRLYAQRKRFTQTDGVSYRSQNCMGYYTISCMDNQNDEPIYRMPLLDYAIKILCVVTYVSWAIYILIMIIRFWRWRV